MKKVTFKVDTTNAGQSISKDFGYYIPAGTVLEVDKITPNLERLIGIGVAEEVQTEKEAPAEKPLQEQTIKQLTAKAAELEIEIPKDVTKQKEIADFIEAELNRRENDANTDPDGKGNFLPPDNNNVPASEE